MTANKSAYSGAVLRPDLQVVADWVRPGTRVLDVGCGDGVLLAYLGRHKSVDGRGMELSQEGVNVCAANGLSVVQGDADHDLRDYPSQAFDCVILSQTIQATRDPARVLRELTRIGHRAIVSFPNFGHWRVRLSLLLRGEMPVTRALSYQWYDTPNIHLCTLRDFTALCCRLDLSAKEAVFLRQGRPYRGWMPNAMSEEAIFILGRR